MYVSGLGPKQKNTSPQVSNSKIKFIFDIKVENKVDVKKKKKKD